MLRKLSLKNTGPAKHLVLDEIAPRFNLITGDNGLGKSFLLEAAWWALTRTWHETEAVPTSPDAAIGYSFDGDAKLHTDTAKWAPAAQEWKRRSGRPPNPGLVLYARVDGSFSVWDPARNYRLYQRADGAKVQSPAAYQFSPEEVFYGLRRSIPEAGGRREQLLCAGLVDDWTRWQDAKDPRFELLCRLLEHLGPDDEALIPGVPLRPLIDDQRRIPTIRMPYGQDVPLTYAPAGVKRMTKLAYLLAWAFSEHQDESRRIDQPVSRQVIVLVDEPETHLHPRWQRTVLPSIAKSVMSWSMDAAPEVQFLVATHSPLVLASMEEEFDVERDALFKLDLVGDDVTIERDDWHKRGDVNRWLESDVFDLDAATSTEAEAVLIRAKHALGAKSPDAAEVRAIDKDLCRILPELDVFLVRWRHYMKAYLPGDVR